MLLRENYSGSPKAGFWTWHWYPNHTRVLLDYGVLVGKSEYACSFSIILGLCSPQEPDYNFLCSLPQLLSRGRINLTPPKTRSVFLTLHYLLTSKNDSQVLLDYAHQLQRLKGPQRSVRLGTTHEEAAEEKEEEEESDESEGSQTILVRD